MLDYILTNTLYRATMSDNSVRIGTIDEISQHFGDGVKSIDRASKQFKELKGFFSDLANYEQIHGHTYIEDYYPIWAKENENADIG